MQLRPRGDGIQDSGFAFSANQRGTTNEGTVPYGLTTLRSDEKSRKPASRQSREQRAEMRFHCVIISPLRTTAISNKMQPSEPFIVTIAETNEGTVPYGPKPTRGLSPMASVNGRLPTPTRQICRRPFRHGTPLGSGRCSTTSTC